MRIRIRKLFIVVICSILTVACSQLSNDDDTFSSYILVENELEITLTPFQPGEEFSLGENFQKTELTATEEIPQEQEIDQMDGPSFAVDVSVPSYISENLKLGTEVTVAHDVEGADIILTQTNECDDPYYGVYALVAPFPTVRDTVNYQKIESAWANAQDVFNGLPLLMGEETYRVFKQIWGEAAIGAVTLKDESQLVGAAWENDQYAIIPFHELDSRWKVIQINGKSPLDVDVTNEEYPLSFRFCITGTEENLGKMQVEEYSIKGLSSNRDIDKMTSLTMTGVTALVRATAHKMESFGINYPGEKVRNLLLDADFTHISNEVAFASTCPFPDPYQSDLRFCSDPEYIGLLEYLDIDIIELTGNHIQDWGREPFVDTLRMYEEDGFAYFGGGRNLQEAKEPLLIEHNGNKLAFIGCNAVGPGGAFATESLSGNAYCGDYSWLSQSVKELTEQGYLVIVTLQHNEFYGLMKTGPQMRDFNPLALAGAVIVSGSQAHYPNPFGFEGTHFIHYGLGNLFFDQMDTYVADGIQREFVDTHYFYDGKYISTEIYTLYLENFAQPRMMTDEERISFLEEAFKASGW